MSNNNAIKPGGLNTKSEPTISMKDFGEMLSNSLTSVFKDFGTTLADQQKLQNQVLNKLTDTIYQQTNNMGDNNQNGGIPMSNAVSMQNILAEDAMKSKFFTVQNLTNSVIGDVNDVFQEDLKSGKLSVVHNGQSLAYWPVIMPPGDRLYPFQVTRFYKGTPIVYTWKRAGDIVSVYGIHGEDIMEYLSRYNNAEYINSKPDYDQIETGTITN